MQSVSVFGAGSCTGKRGFLGTRSGASIGRSHTVWLVTQLCLLLVPGCNLGIKSLNLFAPHSAPAEWLITPDFFSRTAAVSPEVKGR